MPDTDIIREARELCERATPGAWEWKMSKEYYGDIEATYMVSPSEVVIELENDYPGYPECGEHLIMQLTKADADFIARSRTLIPELLDLLAAKDTEIVRIVAEKAAAVSALAFGDDCRGCKYAVDDQSCECSECGNDDTPCDGCPWINDPCSNCERNGGEENNWEWRGATDN